MPAEHNQLIEFEPFKFASIWSRNRSKYLALKTILDGSQNGKYVADLLFLCYNSPIPSATLQSHLKIWEKWYYIQEIGTHYIIRPGGIRFILHLQKKIPTITNLWLTDLYAWRGLDKSCCRTPDGQNWLPKTELMEQLEKMKYHKPGTKRSGSKAGRPANPAPGPVSDTPQSTPAATMPPAPKVPEFPRTTVAPAHPIELPDTPVIQLWSTATGKSEQEEAPPWPRCPSCHRPLEPGYHYWYCSVCDLSYDAAWEPMKGKR
jgi:hypothetical protein